MKRIIFIAFICLVGLVACEQKTDLIIYNKTNYDIFYSLDNAEIVTLNSGQSNSHSYNLGKKWLFEERSKIVKIKIEGETYQMPYNTTETEIKLTAEKDYNIYIWPTHSSIKIINGLDRKITSIKYQKHFVAETTTPVEILNGDLLPSETIYSRLDPMEISEGQAGYFWYTFEITYQPLNYPFTKTYRYNCKSITFDVDFQYVWLVGLLDPHIDEEYEK